ncbi:MAG: hypothetical protein ABI824_19400 [Acidobacteriota bacterium]
MLHLLRLTATATSTILPDERSPPGIDALLKGEAQSFHQLLGSTLTRSVIAPDLLVWESIDDWPGKVATLLTSRLRHELPTLIQNRPPATTLQGLTLLGRRLRPDVSPNVRETEYR